MRKPSNLFTGSPNYDQVVAAHQPLYSEPDDAQRELDLRPWEEERKEEERKARLQASIDELIASNRALVDAIHSLIAAMSKESER